MDAKTLVEVYGWMRGTGLVASKREFSKRWCGKGQTYVTDYVEDDRLDAMVPGAVIERLRDRLHAVAALVPTGAAREIMAIVDRIDRATMVHKFLAR
jgi:hypothetical protein